VERLQFALSLRCLCANLRVHEASHFRKFSYRSRGLRSYQVTPRAITLAQIGTTPAGDAGVWC